MIDTQPNMNPEEIAYVAGLLEGEGCFDRNNKASGVKIRMETTDVDVAERLRDILGCGNIRPRAAKKSTHRPTVIYQIARAEDVRRILTAIRPWMGERRGKKIDSLLEILG